MKSRPRQSEASRVDDMSQRLDNLDGNIWSTPQSTLRDCDREAIEISRIKRRWVMSAGIFSGLIAMGFFIYMLVSDLPDKKLVTKKFDLPDQTLALETDADSYLQAKAPVVEEGSIMVKLEQHNKNRRRINPSAGFQVYLIDDGGTGNRVLDKSCQFFRGSKSFGSYQCTIPIKQEMKPGQYRLSFSQFDGIGFNDAITRPFTIVADDYIPTR